MDIKKILIMVNETHNAADRLRPFMEFAAKMNTLSEELRVLDEPAIGSLLSQKDALNQQLRELQATKDGLNAEVKNLQGVRDKKINEMNIEIERTAKQKQAQATQVHTDLLANHEAALTALRDQKAELEKEVAELLRKRSDLSNAVVALQKQFNQISLSINP